MKPSLAVSSTLELMRTYDRSLSIVFHKTRKSFGGMSNMASGFPLCVNGFIIPTSEALYQTFRFPFQPDIQKLIIGQVNPKIAKEYSRSYIQHSREDWDAIKFKVMRWCLRVKLVQNFDRFSTLLRLTEDKDIVELSIRDDYWGAKPVDNSELLVGQNVLGRLLMELRSCLAANNWQPFPQISPPTIPNAFFLGKEITPVVYVPSTSRQQTIPL